STLDGWWAEAWRADDETGLVHRDNAQPAQDFRMVGDLLLAHCDPLAEKVQIAVRPAGHLFAQRSGRWSMRAPRVFGPSGARIAGKHLKSRGRVICHGQFIPSIRRASLGGQMGGLFFAPKKIGRGEWIRTTGLLVPK